MPVMDLEADSLTPTKIHVISYWDGEKPRSLTTYEEMRAWLGGQDLLIGHNLIGFDIPVIERLLNIEIKAKIIDTLYLAWYLYPERVRYGLEWFGEDYGIPKPPVNDWETQPLEVYIHRCEEDVKINQHLWVDEKAYLEKLYKSSEAENLPIVSYLMFKASCAREQEKNKWKVDIEWCQNALDKMEAQQNPLIETLKSVMPEVLKYVEKLPPPKPYKKDGTLSVEGAKWQTLLRERNLPLTYHKPIRVVAKTEPPNPNSPEQLKDWLYSLGWEPETFKFEKEDNGKERKIPQIKIPNSPDLCPSILRLAEDFPEVSALEGLSVLKHRLGLLKGFLKNVDDEGCLKARVQGLTNTLRFKHTEIVNLPGVGKPWGKEIRGCLVAREGYELVGTDAVSLEDTTKRHYMYFHDPDYVNEMSDPKFDPHLDLAKRSGAVSAEDITLFVNNKDDHSIGGNLKALISSISSLRKSYKVVNYSATYGVGPPKLARELKCAVSKAKKLLEDYWRRNWAVKKVAEECEVKTVNGQKWLFNPVSKFWYSLRNEKDRFSTLNQGTGVYCFDTWVRECRKLKIPQTAQFHDESVSEVPIGEGIKITKLQKQAIKIVNDKLKLNVKLDVTPQIGYRYSDIH